MKKMMLASMAVAALAFASCASDDLVKTPGAEKGKVAMSFSAVSPNMVKAVNTLQDSYTTFGVYTMKEVKGTPNTWQTVMDNYKVDYTTTDPGNNHQTWGDAGATETGKSYWVYDLVDGQNMKYWDMAAVSYGFYAYVPYGKANWDWDNADGKVMTMRIWAGFDAAADKTTGKVQTHNLGMFAYKKAVKESPATGEITYGQDVPLEFKHMNSRLNLAFYSGTPGYEVVVNSIKVEGTKMNMGAVITMKNDGTYAWEKDTENDMVGAFSTENFVVAKNVLKETPADAEKSNYFYCMPALTGTDANSAMKVTVNITMTSESGEVITTDKEVTVGADYVKWGTNKSYTYYFRILGASPIVFDKVEYSDYEEQTPYNIWDIAGGSNPTGTYNPNAVP